MCRMTQQLWHRHCEAQVAMGRSGRSVGPVTAKQSKGDRVELHTIDPYHAEGEVGTVKNLPRTASTVLQPMAGGFRSL